jgi:hypothetical protein
MGLAKAACNVLCVALSFLLSAISVRGKLNFRKEVRISIGIEPFLCL